MPTLVLLQGGIELNANPVLLNTGLTRLPAQTDTGQPTTVQAGQLFPTQFGKVWESQQDIQSRLNQPQSGQLDPSSPGFQEGVTNYTGQSELAPLGLYGFASDGCTYQVQVWGNVWRFNPNPPFNCTQKDYNAGITNPAKLYEGTVSVLPTVSQSTITAGPGSCDGTTVEADIINNPPGFCLTGNCTQIDGCYIVVLGQNCPGDPPGVYSPLVPISNPPPITFPPTIPLPPVPATAPPPVIVGGTVTTVAPGMPGFINFVANPDGTQTANVGLPNCQCTDGDTPTFAVRNVTHDATKPTTVTLSAVAPNSYVFDFNLPGDSMTLVEFDLPMQVWDPKSQSDKELTAKLLVPSDGTNDMSATFGALFLQLAELRAGIVPAVVSPIVPLASN